MATIFTKIIQGDIPCYKIAEDENYLAFLDINPLVKGHTLVIPKKETAYFFNLDDELIAGLNVFAKKIALAIGKVIPCKKVGSAILGLEVPHAHMHLIPINKLGDINFDNPKLSLSDDEFQEILLKIKEVL